MAVLQNAPHCHPPARETGVQEISVQEREPLRPQGPDTPCAWDNAGQEVCEGDP